MTPRGHATAVPLLFALACAGFTRTSAAAPSLQDAPLPPLPVVGGVPTDGDEFDAVVGLSLPGGGGCTGTLVAPRLILTAAHCLDGLPPSQRIVVQFGAVTGTSVMQSESFGVHPRFCAECVEEKHDHGYVTLPQDYFPVGDFIVPIATQGDWDESMRVDNVVTVVGYGTDDPAATTLQSPRTKRKVSTTIRRFSENGLEFFAGGDNRDTCNGDSGGPAIVQLGSGALRLAGITSRGSTPCGNGGWYGISYDALWWVRAETGVNLLPPYCATMVDCLDTTPVVEEEGCGCQTSAEGRGWMVWSLLLLGIRSRRRREPEPALDDVA